MIIRAGVIGLGEVAQLMHLPALADLGSTFRVEAIADVSPSAVRYIKERYGIPRTYFSSEELIVDPELDAVIILSPDQHHGEYAAAALRSGKHVFIEKPAALDPEELRSLMELEKQYPEKVVMVGYMRRYAGSLVKAKEMLGTKPVEYVRFRDIILEAPFFIGQTRPVFYPTDIPEEVIQKSSTLRKEQLDAVLGADCSPRIRQAYQMLAGLGCHSFSAVRELLGLPKRVLSAVSNHTGEQLVIALEYDGFIGTYELVNNQQIVQFDAAIELFQGNRKLKVKYETPYIRHQAGTLEVTESSETDTKTTCYGPDYRDPFTTELLEFHRCIEEGAKPKTTLADSLEDLLFFGDIITALKKEA